MYTKTRNAADDVTLFVQRLTQAIEGEDKKTRRRGAETLATLIQAMIAQHNAPSDHSATRYELLRGFATVAEFDDPNALAGWLEDAVADRTPITPFDVVALCDDVDLWTMQADKWLSVWQSGGRDRKLYPINVRMEAGTWRGIAVEQSEADGSFYWTITRPVVLKGGGQIEAVIWDHCPLPEAVEYLEAVKDRPHHEYYVQKRLWASGEAIGAKVFGDAWLRHHGRHYWRLTLDDRVEYHVTYGVYAPTPACVEMSADEFDKVFSNPHVQKPMVLPGKTLHAVMPIGKAQRETVAPPDEHGGREVAIADMAAGVVLNSVDKDVVRDALQAFALFVKYADIDLDVLAARGLLVAFWDRMMIGASTDVFDPEDYDLLRTLENEIKIKIGALDD